MSFSRWISVVCAIGALEALFLVACPPPQPPVVGPDADAQVWTVDVAPLPPAPPSAGCKGWCDNAAKMHCSAAEPTPDGVPCADVCQTLVNAGLAIDLSCRALATTCAGADECEAVWGRSPSDPPEVRAAIADMVAPTCENWCRQGQKMHCPSAAPTPSGASCGEVCANVQKGKKKFDLKCRLAAKTCAAAEHCEH